MEFTKLVKHHIEKSKFVKYVEYISFQLIFTFAVFPVYRLPHHFTRIISSNASSGVLYPDETDSYQHRFIIV